MGRPRTWVSAMAKSVAQKTTCSTSLFAAASKKLWGTMCSRKPPNVVGAALGIGGVGVGRAAARRRRPGWVMLTAISPMARAMLVMSQK